MPAIKRILLTNDDGIDAPGLAHAEAIAGEIAEQVWVVAPATDQSGVGQGVTMHHPLEVTRHGPRRYSVTGTPADCVMVALAEICRDQPPDLVLSGVNAGANLSDSVMYSGTVGAVLAADHMGLAAIALSQAFHHPQPIDYATTRAHAQDVITLLWARRDVYGCCWNINMPVAGAAPVRGVRFTRAAPGGLRAPRLAADSDGDASGSAYWLGFERDTTVVTAPESDVVALRDNYISATALRGTRNNDAIHERAAAAGELALPKAAPVLAVENTIEESP